MEGVLRAYDKEYHTFAFPNDRFSVVLAWVNKKIIPQRQLEKTAADRRTIATVEIFNCTGMSNEGMQDGAKFLFEVITGYFISSLTSILQQSIKALCP